LVYVT